MARSAEILVEACSFAGTGNVLKVQQMLQICAEHAEAPKAKDESETEAAAPAEATPTSVAGTASTPAAGTENAEGYTAVPTQDQNMDQDNAEASTSNAEAAAAKKAKEMRKQSVATIGIALIAMGEEVGAEMALRQFQHLVRRPT